MLKSGATTLTVTVVEWDSEPLVPVTVTVWLPAVDEETLRFEDPVPPDESVTLVGLRDAIRPEGDTDAERVTVPEKLLRLARLTVDASEDPI